METKNYPAIVYKYRNWTDINHKNVLLKNELFLASPNYCNDPFDCRIPDDYSLLNTEEKRREKVDQLIVDHFDQMIKDGKDVDAEIKKLDKKFTDIIKTQSEYEFYLFQSQDLYYGILSLSARWNSILMWSHYSNNHTGYCIGLHEQKLRESRLFGMGGSVYYTNDFPSINPLDEKGNTYNMFQETHVKAKDWLYEEEYRLTFNFFPNVVTDKERAITVPDDFVAEVIIGLLAEESTVSEIVEYCRIKKIEVYKLSKVPRKFQLKREKI